jgi:hypothetical protein
MRYHLLSDTDTAPRERPEGLQGLSEDKGPAVTDGATCGVSVNGGSVRGSG